MPLSASLVRHLQSVTGQALVACRSHGIGGGDINAAYRLQAAGVDWFIKTNRAELATMFAAEAAGLQELAAQRQLRVPNVVCHGSDGHQAFLALEYIELTRLHGNAAARLGQQLAALHRAPQAFFGWHIDNAIGSTPQHNDRSNDWLAFWQTIRLGKQLQFAAHNGFTGTLQRNGEKLLGVLPLFFSGYLPHPSLLHGDLWAGNAAADSQGNPVIYDPACYYGDREADLAMTELFGGFSADFKAAYHDNYPVDPGYTVRKTLYNLYHILNHLNLFGGGYLRQAEQMIESLLSEAG
ncbi:MAG: fructosamine kinase family protein [Methylomonas sp.]|nr:fructosamine kinase family protein [Methylomonas sp.]PPD20279.1 MAG: hypothetical protein CTY23_09395 [Methylomonas sp.]PPD25458.1 MAG: hypothetical protein CTY22_08580 [Methylomonas sp.]PPD36160.1 MAG: hypothetical protein CTY21_08585 [Methylomonas sp.]PPD41176.1 MAG: hypothetical protein CTY17_04445 [Methylomonas sp.]